MNTYKHVKLHILKSSFKLVSLFMNTLLCQSLSRLIVDPKFALELGSFAK